MRNVVLLIGVLTVNFASSARSQDTDVAALQLKACTLINEDAARVRCYDHAMSRPASKPAMVDLGAEPQLVVIPQSSAAVPQSPASSPQLSTIPPQSPSAPKSNPPSNAPATAKSESSNNFGVNTIMEAITPSAVTALIQPGSSKNDYWQVKADNPVIQQATRLIGTLKSSDDKATLVLQCQGGVTQAYLSTKSFLGWEASRVLYRLNGNPAIESRWPNSPDGRAAIPNNPIEFINSLPEGGTLDVRLVDYSEANHDLKFSLGAISNVRTQIATICRWPGATVEDKVVSEQKLPNQRSPNPNAPTRVGPPLRLQ